MIRRTRRWSSMGISFAVAGAAAMFVGWLTGWWAVVIAVWLGSYLAWNALQLYRLDRWLQRGAGDPPESIGVWGGIFSSLYASRRRARKRHRRLLRLARAFRRASSVLPDATILLDRDATILWFNSRAPSMLGLRRPQDLNQSITNVLRMPRFGEWLQRSMIQPAEALQMEAPGTNGEMVQAVLIPYAEDQFLLLVRDVSKLHKLEQVRRDFVANVSHELRTPLTVIHGYLEALQNDLDEPWSPVVERMQQQAERMRAIVDDLLTLSRLETSETAPITVCVDIAGMANTLRQEVLALSNGRHEIDFDIDASANICGVEQELYSAFSNLLSNAVRYTPENGRINVRWGRGRSEGFEFSVTDTGPGIPRAHLDRITERFYRVSPGRSRNTGGTGLGLSIVKHTLDRHQAHLAVTSEIGVGSTFRCVFPLERIAKQGDRECEPPLDKAG